jgi:hypothetical protein
VKIVNNSFTDRLAQLVSNDRSQCQYTTAATGIGIVFLVIGAILGIGGAKSKEREEQTAYSFVVSEQLLSSFLCYFDIVTYANKFLYVI